MNSNRAQISIRDAAIGYVAAWLVGGLAFSSVLAVSGFTEIADAGPGWLLAASVAEWLPFLVALWILGRKFGTGKPAADYGLSFRWIDLIGLPIGALTQLVLLPLLYWPLQAIWPDAFSNDDIEKGARDLWDNAHGFGVVALVLVVVVGAPFVEELVYRGLLQGALGRRMHQWNGGLAVVLIAALFALMHFLPVEYPGLFLVGLILGTCALRTGRLGMGFLVHLAFNAAGLILVASS